MDTCIMLTTALTLTLRYLFWLIVDQATLLSELIFIIFGTVALCLAGVGEREHEGARAELTQQTAGRSRGGGRQLLRWTATGTSLCC